MNKKINFYSFVTRFFFLLFLFCTSSQCYWYEYESPAVGNLPNLVGFREIPDSYNLLFMSSAYKNLVLFDKKSMKIRGSLKNEFLKNNSVIFSNPTSGWDFYYTNETGFYRLHIKEEGEFGEVIRLNDKDLSSSKLLDIPERK
ncbi:hypothetical protein KKB18_13110, partial [bacterium]|nr:hypothetical protein [bacterium]